MKNGFRIIDGDGHMQEPMDMWEKYVEAAYRERMPKVIGHVGRTLFEYAPCEAFPEGRLKPRPDSIFDDCPARYGEAYDDWWSLSSRLKAMDAEGIDVMVGFPTNGGVATNSSITDGKLQAALCRAYNDWARDYCTDSHDRVKYIAKVTSLDVDLAIAEIRRVGNQPQVAAVVLPDPGAQRLWSTAEFDPLWATLCDYDLPASLHGGLADQNFFKPWRENGLAAVGHALGFPLDSMLAMGTMIFGGVLERFPKLRAGFYEANAGWLAWWLARMDDHAVGRQGRFMYGFSLPLSPSEYFKRQCFVACDADEGALRPVVEQMHGDNILFNTDYPHPDAPMPGAVDMFLKTDIPDSAKRKILWDNSIALYGDRVAPSSVAA